MVESLVWDKNSIININNDTMTKHTGTATVSNGSLVLEAQSSATYNYSYNTTDNIKQTKDLKFILDVINSNETVNSRYDESVQVEVYIQYYKKQLDDKGNVIGYLLGINDTYQINPYFRHEVEGYTDTYEIGINDEMMIFIEINFINNSDNQITFVNPRVFNSMSVMDAIDEYGGGEEPGPSEPTLKNDLILYSTSGNYTISNTDGQLILQVEVSDDVLSREYPDGADIGIKWLHTAKSGQGSAFVNTVGDPIYKYINGKQYKIWNTITTYTAISNGVLNVRVEIDGNNTVYAERDITMTNNEVTDMELKIESPSGKIEGTNYSNASIKLLPETNRSGTGGAGDDMEIVSLVTYDGYGEAEIGSWEGTIQGGRVNFQIKGKKNGKVKLTVKIISGVYTRFYPLGFTKEFIIDVVDVPEVSALYTRTPNGQVIDATKEYIDIIVGTNISYNLRTDSNYGLESLDGVGQGYVTLLTNSFNKELTYRVYPVTPGKIKFWGEMMHHYGGASNGYAGRVEVTVDITALYKELTTEITTNTGLFEITDGTGQLEVYCTPNYSYAGGYSFSQVSIDGGSVSLSDKGNYALITADREGKLNLICKPDRGKSVQREISISNQYPEDVQLTCADNIFKVPINGTLMIYAEASNKPNSNYDKYEWVSEKLDADVSWETTTWDKEVKYKGLNLGKIRVSAVRKVDSKFMASQVIKVVQSLDSDKTVLTYPNSQKYWVVYRRTDQGNRLWLVTIDGTVTLNKLIKKTDNRLYTDNITLGAREQYNIESGQWAKYGNWSGSTSCAGSVGQLYASNLDIYNEDGNLLLAKTDNYDDVDFDAIIYGQDVYLLKAVELKTSKDTVYTDTEVKVEALNSDDTVAYDWQFVGTDVTVIEKTNRHVIFKSTSSGNLKVNYILSESGNIITGTDLKIIDKPTNLKYIRLYITKAYRNNNTVGYCNMSELDILDSNGNSVLTDSCVYTADSVYSGSSDVPANAFDKNTSTIWHSADSSNAHWIQIEFASGIDLPSSYVVTRRTDNWNDYLASWELQASTDGSTWLTVDKHTDDTNWSSGYSRTFNL